MFRSQRPMNLPVPGFLPSREIERFFNDMLGSFPMLAPLPAAAQTARADMPAVNMWEDDHAVFVEAELPGLTMHDIDVSLDGTTLTIKGTRPTVVVDDKAKVLRRERPAGEFGCTISVPVEFDADKASAALEHGVLLVTLPKSCASRARKIEIKAR